MSQRSTLIALQSLAGSLLLVGWWMWSRPALVKLPYVTLPAAMWCIGGLIALIGLRYSQANRSLSAGLFLMNTFSAFIAGYVLYGDQQLIR